MNNLPGSYVIYLAHCSSWHYS